MVNLLPTLKHVSFNFSLVFLAILVNAVLTVNVGEQGELQGLHDVTDAHSVVLLVDAGARASSHVKFGKL